MKYDNVFFINGMAYAGKSTMIRKLSEKDKGGTCKENYDNDKKCNGK